MRYLISLERREGLVNPVLGLNDGHCIMVYEQDVELAGLVPACLRGISLHFIELDARKVQVLGEGRLKILLRPMPMLSLAPDT